MYQYTLYQSSQIVALTTKMLPITTFAQTKLNYMYRQENPKSYRIAENIGIWLETNLAVRSQITITKILADLNLAVW